MSSEETPTNVESAEAKAEVSIEQDKLTLSEALEQIASLKRSNDRLLDESKSHKSKFIQLKDQVDSEKKKYLEEQGKFKELYESVNEKYQRERKDRLRERVELEVTKVAQKLGAEKVEAVLKLGKPSLLQIDEETGDVHGIDMFVEDVKKDYPVLFSSARPSVNPANPGGPSLTEKKLTAKDVSKLGAAEKESVWVELMKRQNP